MLRLLAATQAIQYILIIGTTYMAYPIVGKLLEYTPQYSDSTRKRYIVKNTLKSFSLATLLCYALCEIMTVSSWDNKRVCFVATAYVANDIVGLLTCKLPWSTTLHHTIACAFLVFSFFVDFGANVEAQMIFYYTFFSASTFYVNLYLGIRLCYPRENKGIHVLRAVSKWGYAATLVVNWSVQIARGWGEVSMWYILLITFIVYDDIVLLRWLWK